MLCNRCQAENPDSNRYCEACGAALERQCAKCGHANRGTARFCGQCGIDLAASRGPVPNGAPRHEPGPPNIATHIRSSRFADGERKQVTILFADIRGSMQLIQALDPELALQRLDPGLHAMADAVRRYGGIVNRMQGDGIMALFGAPVAAEDHAIRACRAARAMLDAVAALGSPQIQIRVGLNSGEVVVRSMGNDISMEYDAVGSDAHLAHRVEQLALPGCAYLTARTLRLASGFVEARPLGLIEIKGIDAPIELFELLSIVERPRWDVRVAARTLSRFVGRDVEMALLLDAARHADFGRGRVVAAVGDAGMGKSRLVYEFCRSGAVRDWTILRVAALSYDRGTPYRVVSDLIRCWIGITESDGQAEIGRKLRQALASFGENAPVDLPALRSLLDLPVEDADWSDADPQQRRQRILRAVQVVVFRQAALKPTVLVIEDMHWADGESQVALDAVVEGAGAARLLIVATGRLEWHPGWTDRSYCSLIHVGPLEAAAAHALVHDILSGSPDLDVLRERLVEQTEATPLFLEEMARTLVESGVVVGEPVRYRLTRHPDDVDIPESVQALLAARLDRLPAEHRELLQIASVIGRRVPLALLRAVADVPEDRLRRQLAALQALEFLYETYVSTAAEYTFKHALTHAVAYESMLLRHRRGLHARVLDAIETGYPDRIGEFTERLADHAIKAELWPKAVDYCYRAGQRANFRSAYREAIPFFERALDALSYLPPDPAGIERGIQIRLGLRIALASTADLMRIRECLDEAEQLAETLADKPRLASIKGSQCTILTLLGAVHAAIDAGRRARSIADAINDPGLKINAGFALGQAYSFQGELRQAAAILNEDLPRILGDLRHAQLGTTGTPSVLCLSSLANTYSLLGDLARAFACAADACSIARETERAYDLSYANLAYGLARLTRGETDLAVESLEEALRHCRSGELRILFPSISRFLGQAYTLTGRVDDACALLGDAVAESRSKGLLAFQAWCGVSLGFALLAKGEQAAAGDVAVDALRIARDCGLRTVEVQALRLTAALCAARGDGAQEAGQRACRDALALANLIGMRPEAAHCHFELGELFRRSGAIDDARKELAAARDLFALLEMDPLAHVAEASLRALPGLPPSDHSDRVVRFRIA